MLKVKDLCIYRGNALLKENRILKDVSFEVEDGEYCVLVGPTGGGKTVTLESIAGIYSGTRSGEIWINDRDVTSLSLEERKIGFAYQKYALYRHLSVRDNISFGLMFKDKSQKEIDQAVDQVIELLHLQDLLDKKPWGLSGGESQRICLARAIAIRPDLLLLDEPFSAVDVQLREGVGRELQTLHSELKLTTLHVTHDFGEAMAIGDRAVVLMDGEVRQIGTPEEVFRHPDSEMVARFLLTRNIFEGEVQDGSGGQGVFCPDGDGDKLNVETALRGKRYATIRSEDISISREPLDSDGVNSLAGTITLISDRGAIAYVWVNVPPEFICLLLHPTFAEMSLEEGQKVYITFTADALNVF